MCHSGIVQRPWIRKRNDEKKNRDESRPATTPKTVHGATAGRPTT